MKVLWVCNIMPPIVAEALHLESSNKEGWIAGLLQTILERQDRNGVELGIAFPVEKNLASYQGEVKGVACYGFYEEVLKAEAYGKELEGRLREILQNFAPDVIHCFGTEYGHTLAMTRVCTTPWRVLVGLQGLCTVCAQAYMADLPKKIQKQVTFRDWLKQDSIVQQQEKFALRGITEQEAVEKAGYRVGEDIVYAMDAAASELYDEARGVYVFPGESKGNGEEQEIARSSEEMIAMYEELVQQFPIVSIEDGLFEDDWEGWQKLTKRLGDKVQLVGDDLFVTNPKRIQCGIKLGAANAVLVKVNQIGTVTESLNAIEMAKSAGYHTVISHRSGETEDAFIADLAVAVNAGQIKTGAPCRAERTSKYNQLLRIEEELAEDAVFVPEEITEKQKAEKMG